MDAEEGGTGVRTTDAIRANCNKGLCFRWKQFAMLPATTCNKREKIEPFTMFTSKDGR